MADKPDVTPPTKPGTGEKPDNTLPGTGDKPDQGLPGDRPKPDQGLPGRREGGAEPKTEAYKLKADVGPHINRDGKVTQEGETVLLTESQAEYIGDKFEKVGK
jgi:hypothetical protein